MLSSTATVHSNPQLEIYNNDVKCSHGSTTGQLDSEMLFYLQSRGINLEQARMMLLSGFLNEFIESVNTKDYPKYLTKKLTAGYTTMINNKILEIKNIFEIFDNPMDKYTQIIEMGKKIKV